MDTPRHPLAPCWGLAQCTWRGTCPPRGDGHARHPWPLVEGRRFNFHPPAAQRELCSGRRTVLFTEGVVCPPAHTLTAGHVTAVSVRPGRWISWRFSPGPVFCFHRGSCQPTPTRAVSRMNHGWLRGPGPHKPSRPRRSTRSMLRRRRARGVLNRSPTPVPPYPIPLAPSHTAPPLPTTPAMRTEDARGEEGRRRRRRRRGERGER